MRSTIASIAALSGILLFPALSRAWGDETAFRVGAPLEIRGGDYYQNGTPVARKTMETALASEVPASQPLMSSALRLRRSGRVCLGIGLPLLIGGVVTAIVASSGTVGSGTGTMAVYGVSLGLLGVSLALDITATVLLVKSKRRYRNAVDEYNRSVGGQAAAMEIRIHATGSGLALSASF